jgi:hypothetical protein
MEEIHRVSRNGAKIYISMSHFSSAESFTNPTHKHFFTTKSFDYFTPGTYLYSYKYSRVNFRKIKVWLGPTAHPNPLVRLLLYYINKYSLVYEKHFAFIFPVGAISYELEVDKNQE